MTQSRQAGSVGTFVIVTVLLAAALIGGVFWLRTNSEDMKVAQNPVQDSSNTKTDDAKQAEQSVKEDREKKEAEKQATEKKAQEQQAAALAAEQARNKEIEAKKQQSTETATTQQASTPVVPADTPNSKQTVASTANSLPQTGATEDLTSMMVGFSAIVAATLAYRRSVKIGL